MKRILLVAAVLAAGVLVSGEAWAKSGNELYKECTVEKTSSNYYIQTAYCFAYIRGVAETLDDNSLVKNSIANFCLPNDATYGQALDVVKKWLSNNPQDRHLAAYSLVAYSLSKAWPCPK